VNDRWKRPEQRTPPGSAKKTATKNALLGGRPGKERISFPVENIVRAPSGRERARTGEPGPRLDAKRKNLMRGII